VPLVITLDNIILDLKSNINSQLFLGVRFLLISLFVQTQAFVGSNSFLVPSLRAKDVAGQRLRLVQTVNNPF
jgi:hypothetical protein